MNLYNIVTNDEYELPVKCDLRVREAAEFFGTNTNNVRRMVCRPPKKSQYKVVVSGKVEYDQKAYNKTYGSQNIRKDDASYQEAFSREWDSVVERLRSRCVDLGKIRIRGVEKQRC